MKTSRIFPYNKTKGERRHEHEVNVAKNAGFKHPGSSSAKMLHYIQKDGLKPSNRRWF